MSNLLAHTIDETMLELIDKQIKRFVSGKCNAVHAMNVIGSLVDQYANFKAAQRVADEAKATVDELNAQAEAAAVAYDKARSDAETHYNLLLTSVTHAFHQDNQN